MAATTFGTGIWGIPADETGIIIESISHNYGQSEKTLKDRTGNTNSVTFYDENVKVSLKGRVPSTASFSGTLASALTLTNPMSAYLKIGAPVGLVLVNSINVDYNNEDYRSISIEATRWPLIVS